jgi:hypothetical protein
MKTAVIMLRDLNGVKIRQNHKTSFFNANDLLELYNDSREKKKDMTSYLRSKQFKDFRKEVIKDISQNTQIKRISKTASAGQLEPLDILPNEVCEVKRGKNGGTWLHPYLFMDFAMWLSPTFKLTCIKWIYDKLIQTRDEAGETFKEVNLALFEAKPNSAYWVYANEAKMINKLVFDSPESDQRNTATESQLELIRILQKADAKLITHGYEYHDRYEKLKNLKSLL